MAQTVQAIPGLSAADENIVTAVYPSMGGDRFGQMIARLLGCLPIPLLPFKRVKLSHLLFGPLVAPLGAGWFLLKKVVGSKYEITNQHLRVRPAVPLLAGDRVREEISLEEIASVEINQLSGQTFYECGDVTLKSADGRELLTLRGVPRPEVFRQNLHEVTEARASVRRALDHIRSRR